MQQDRRRLEYTNGYLNVPDLMREHSLLVIVNVFQPVS